MIKFKESDRKKIEAEYSDHIQGAGDPEGKCLYRDRARTGMSNLLMMQKRLSVIHGAILLHTKLDRYKLETMTTDVYFAQKLYSEIDGYNPDATDNLSDYEVMMRHFEDFRSDLMAQISSLPVFGRINASTKAYDMYFFNPEKSLMEFIDEELSIDRLIDSYR